MKVLRTPDERFADLPDFPYPPRYAEVAAEGGTRLRLHYLDQGLRDGATVLLLHGEPSWCYLYRKMIPPLAAAGYRCIVPDLIGFGSNGVSVYLGIGNGTFKGQVYTVKYATTTTEASSVNPSVYGQSVTFTATLSGDMPSFLATWSRVPCGLCTQAQTSHLPSAIRTVADGGSIVACARCGM